MQRRSPAAVLLLPFITFGIYAIVWFAKTRGEMSRLGIDVPTTWLYIVPFVNIWWLWKFGAGAARVTGGSSGANFALLLFLGVIGQAIVQADLNSQRVVARAPGY